MGKWGQVGGTLSGGASAETTWSYLRNSQDSANVHNVRMRELYWSTRLHAKREAGEQQSLTDEERRNFFYDRWSEMFRDEVGVHYDWTVDSAQRRFDSSRITDQMNDNREQEAADRRGMGFWDRTRSTLGQGDYERPGDAPLPEKR